MAAKNFWRKWFGRGIDRLAWHSMHLIARRQEKKVAPSYPADLRQPLADPAALFAASTGRQRVTFNTRPGKSGVIIGDVI